MAKKKIVKRKRPAEKIGHGHVSHYGGADNPYEAIKVLEARMTPEEVKGYLKGTVYTYNDRAIFKGTELEDYEKGLWFQDRLVKFMRKQKQNIKYKGK